MWVVAWVPHIVHCSWLCLGIHVYLMSCLLVYHPLWCGCFFLYWICLSDCLLLGIIWIYDGRTSVFTIFISVNSLCFQQIACPFCLKGFLLGFDADLLVIIIMFRTMLGLGLISLDVLGVRKKVLIKGMTNEICSDWSHVFCGHFVDRRTILEIMSGTSSDFVYFRFRTKVRMFFIVV